MAATFAIGTLPAGVSAPANCVIEKLDEKESVETYSYRDATGVTVHAVPGKLITKEVTVSLIGSAPLALTAGAFTAGTLKVVGVKLSESNEDFPKSTQTYKSYSTAA